MFIIYPSQSMLAPVQLGIRFLFSKKFNSCGNCSFGTLSWINSRQVAGESVTTALPFTANRSSLRCSFSEIRSFLSTVLPYFELLVPSLNFVHFWAKHLPRSRNAEPLHNLSMYSTIDLYSLWTSGKDVDFWKKGFFPPVCLAIQDACLLIFLYMYMYFIIGVYNITSMFTR